MAEEFNHWDDIALQLGVATSRAVRKAALDIQADAATKAPVYTGFLKGSIYAVTSDKRYKTGFHSGYKKSERMLPEVPSPPDDQTAYVAVGAEYGADVEFGTAHMSARPFFTPAVEQTRASFEQALSETEQKLKEATQ